MIWFIEILQAIRREIRRERAARNAPTCEGCGRRESVGGYRTFCSNYVCDYYDPTSGQR